MKNYLFFLLFIFSLNILSLPKIYNTGRLEKETDFEYETIQTDSTSTIRINGQEFIGNYVIELQIGYLTFFKLNEATPTEIRYYNYLGKELWMRIFTNVINPKISPNGKYLIFSDSSDLNIINISKNNLTTKENALLYAVSNKGKIATANINNYSVFNEIKPFENIIDILVVKNSFYFIGKNKIILVNKNRNDIIFEIDSDIFDTIISKKQLFYTTREIKDHKFIFSAYKLSSKSELIKSWEFTPTIKNIENNEKRSPLEYENNNYFAKVTTNYGQIVSSLNKNFLSPCVKILGEPNQPVFSVTSGFITSIMTTSSKKFWRITISENKKSPKGYLYAHINRHSIPFKIGDFVKKGSQIGTLFDEKKSTLSYLSFAKIYNEDKKWAGHWKTDGNPLSDISNYTDSLPPQFENISDKPIIFRSKNNIYLDNKELYGDVEIIVNPYDYSNTKTKIDIYKIFFEVKSLNSNEIVYTSKTLKRDYILDNYTIKEKEKEILNQIYINDDIKKSYAYKNKQYFLQKLSNNNKESKSYLPKFSTTDLPNGEYQIIVTAYDIKNNKNSTSININILNDNNAPVFNFDSENIILEKDNPVTINLFEKITDDNTPKNKISFSFEPSSKHLKINFNKKKGELTLKTKYKDEFYTLLINAKDNEGEISTKKLFLSPYEKQEEDRFTTSLNITPNPYSKLHHKKNVLIEYNSPTQKNLKIDLFNKKGDFILNIFTGNISSSQHSIILNKDILKNLNNGIYLIKIFDGYNYYSQNFIVLK